MNNRNRYICYKQYPCSNYAVCGNGYYKYRRGFSYAEILVSAVILAILAVSALKLFGNIGISANLVHKYNIADKLALDMINEIMTKHYRDPQYPDNVGVESNENNANRLDFDDIDDYDGWDKSPPQYPDGTTYTDCPAFERKVKVVYVDPDDFSNVIDHDQGFKEVIIKIKENGVLLKVYKYVIPDNKQ